MNSNGPNFGEYVALPSGGELIPLPLTSATPNANIISISNSMNTYPNPVLNSLIINRNELINTISIYDIAGKIVINQVVNSYEENINFESLKSGQYFLIISDENKNQTVKQIIKQ